MCLLDLLFRTLMSKFVISSVFGNLKKKLDFDAVLLTKNMYVVAPLSFRMDAKRSFQSTLLNGEREMGYCYAREFCRVSASSISIGFGEL